MKDKPKYARVLDALQLGLEVVFPEFATVAMFEDEKGRRRLWAKLENITPGRPESDRWRYAAFDVPVNDFLQMCEELPDDYIWRLSADTSLNKIRRSQR